MLIVDAGPLYATAAEQDNNHSACEKLLSETTGPLLVPELVVTARDRHARSPSL